MKTEKQLSDLSTTWERYVASWKAETTVEKRALYEQALSSRCVYRDPLTVADGWEQLLEYMDSFHRQIPGGHFVTTEFMAHHGRSIARWEMRDGKATKIGVGMSYGEYDDQGKLTSMTGFFETADAHDAATA